MAKPSLNDFLRDIVKIDQRLLTYRGADVIHFDVWKQEKEDRRKLVAAIENAPRGNTNGRA